MILRGIHFTLLMKSCIVTLNETQILILKTRQGMLGSTQIILKSAMKKILRMMLLEMIWIFQGQNWMMNKRKRAMKMKKIIITASAEIGTMIWKKIETIIRNKKLKEA